jgi:hypothetical protein
MACPLSLLSDAAWVSSLWARSVLVAGLQAASTSWSCSGVGLTALAFNPAIGEAQGDGFVPTCSSIDNQAVVGKELSALSQSLDVPPIKRAGPDRPTIHELASMAEQQLRSLEEDDPGPHQGWYRIRCVRRHQHRCIQDLQLLEFTEKSRGAHKCLSRWPSGLADCCCLRYLPQALASP